MENAYLGNEDNKISNETKENKPIVDSNHVKQIQPDDGNKIVLAVIGRSGSGKTVYLASFYYLGTRNINGLSMSSKIKSLTHATEETRDYFYGDIDDSKPTGISRALFEAPEKWKKGSWGTRKLSKLNFSMVYDSREINLEIHDIEGGAVENISEEAFAGKLESLVSETMGGLYIIDAAEYLMKEKEVLSSFRNHLTIIKRARQNFFYRNLGFSMEYPLAIILTKCDMLDEIQLSKVKLECEKIIKEELRALLGMQIDHNGNFGFFINFINKFLPSKSFCEVFDIVACGKWLDKNPPGEERLKLQNTEKFFPRNLQKPVEFAIESINESSRLRNTRKKWCAGFGVIFFLMVFLLIDFSRAVHLQTSLDSLIQTKQYSEAMEIALKGRTKGFLFPSGNKLEGYIKNIGILWGDDLERFILQSNADEIETGDNNQINKRLVAYESFLNSDEGRLSNSIPEVFTKVSTAKRFDQNRKFAIELSKKLTQPSSSFDAELLGQSLNLPNDMKKDWKEKVRALRINYFKIHSEKLGYQDFVSINESLKRINGFLSPKPQKEYVEELTIFENLLSFLSDRIFNKIKSNALEEIGKAEETDLEKLNKAYQNKVNESINRYRKQNIFTGLLQKCEKLQKQELEALNLEDLALRIASKKLQADFQNDYVSLIQKMKIDFKSFDEKRLNKEVSRKQKEAMEKWIGTALEIDKKSINDKPYSAFINSAKFLLEKKAEAQNAKWPQEILSELGSAAEKELLSALTCIRQQFAGESERKNEFYDSLCEIHPYISEDLTESYQIFKGFQDKIFNDVAIAELYTTDQIEELENWSEKYLVKRELPFLNEGMLQIKYSSHKEAITTNLLEKAKKELDSLPTISSWLDWKKENLDSSKFSGKTDSLKVPATKMAVGILKNRFESLKSNYSQEGATKLIQEMQVFQNSGLGNHEVEKVLSYLKWATGKPRIDVRIGEAYSYRWFKQNYQIEIDGFKTFSRSNNAYTFQINQDLSFNWSPDKGTVSLVMLENESSVINKSVNVSGLFGFRNLGRKWEQDDFWFKIDVTTTADCPWR